MKRGLTAALLLLGMLICTQASAAIVQGDWRSGMLGGSYLPALVFSRAETGDAETTVLRYGPGEQYAAVDEEFWLGYAEVAGVENGWALVRDGDGIGYIDAACLQDAAQIEPLSLLQAVLPAPNDCCIMTPDIFGNTRQYIALVRKGEPLTLLARYEDAVYVEYAAESGPVRGFIAEPDYSFAAWRDVLAEAGVYTGPAVDLKALYRAQYTQYKKDSVAAGYGYTIGLRADGTCIARGENEYGQCSVQDWRNIVAVSAGGGHTVGLRADGTVVSAGRNDAGQCDVGAWTGIVAVSAGDEHTVGLTEDGQVVIAGDNSLFQHDMQAWHGESIVAISAGGTHTLALTADGRVLRAGGMYDLSYAYFLDPDESENIHGIVPDTRNWSRAIAISAGGAHAACLRADGTVRGSGESANGQLDYLRDWQGIAAIAATGGATYGLTESGWLLDAAYDDGEDEESGVYAGSAVFMDASDTQVVCVRADGTAAAFPPNQWEPLLYDLEDWDDIGLSAGTPVFEE